MFPLEQLTDGGPQLTRWGRAMAWWKRSAWPRVWVYAPPLLILGGLGTIADWQVDDVLRLFGVAFSGFIAFAAIHAHSRFTHELMYRMGDEYDLRGIAHRRAFNSGIVEDFDKFAAGEGVGEREWGVHVRRAGVPPRLMTCPNIRRYKLTEDDYPDDDRQRAASMRLLWKYAKSRYPAEGARIGEPRRMSDEIDDARSHLGGFWDRWAVRLRPQRVARQHLKDIDTILMLTWLDPAHRSWVGEDHRGKQGLYRLARILHKGCSAALPNQASDENPQ